MAHRFLTVPALAASLALAPAVFMPTFGPAFAQQQSFDTAVAVIEGQIRAFKSQRHEDAFGFASPNIRRMFGSTDRFVGMVKSGYGAIYGAESWSFGRSRSEGNRLFQEVDLIGPDGLPYRALYTLERQADGTLRIAGVQVRKGNALAT